MQKPKATKVPASGKPTAKYSRGRFGEPLNVPSVEFDLTESNLKQTCGAYNCFHDPMLKKQLLKHGLVTEDKVLCSLKEFNHYIKYIKSVQENWNKLLLKEQKLLLKDFMLQQMEGKIPENVSFAHVKESLISESKSTFRTLFGKVLRSGETLHDAELEWERTQRLQLGELKKEIIRELRAEGKLYQVPVKSLSLESSAQLAAMCVIRDILMRTGESPGSDLSLLDSAPTTKNSTGKKKISKTGKRVYAFFRRSWESMRQIFTNARRSNRIHVL